MPQACEKTKGAGTGFSFSAMRKGMVAACLPVLAALSYSSADPTVTVGDRVTVLGDKAGGLIQFPEMPLSILQTTPEYHVLIATATKTAYCTGSSMSTLTAKGVAMQPGTNKSAYDGFSTSIGGTWKDPNSSDIYAVFNAWDSSGVPRIPGDSGRGWPGRYFSTALAKSTNGGQSFTKIGPILQVPKSAYGDPLQGDAHACVLMDKDKQYLLAYYGDMFNASIRSGVQTCVARAPIASNGMPGNWMKYNGDWTTKGLSTVDSMLRGAETTPVILCPAFTGDAMYPDVVWSEKAKAYIMVYAVDSFDEQTPPDAPMPMSGIYIAFSGDGLNWVGQQKLVAAITVDYPGREVALHPTIVVDDTPGGNLKATLYYGYSKEMWTGTTQYLVSHSLDIPLPLSTDRVLFHSSSKSRVGDFMLSQGGASSWMINFGQSDVNGLRVVGANGSAAGQTLKVGSGLYRLQLTRTAPGPLYLQGNAGGQLFSSLLNLH